MSGFLSGLSARVPRFGRGKSGASAGQVAPILAVGALAGLCIWQTVRLTYVVVTPVGPLGDWQPKGAAILPVAERAKLFAAFDPFFRSAGAAASDVATVTSLGLTLFGVNVNEATGGGSAIIAGEDGVQNSYAVGDEVAAGVKLAAIAFDHVILERGGVRESLFMDQSGEADVVNPAAVPAPIGAAPTTAVQPVAAGVAANGEMSPDALKKGLRFAPRMEGGRLTGLSVEPQGDGALFRAAGLRSGDVVRAINGRPISSAADVTNALKSGARISLDVERGASSVPIALFLSKS